MLKSFFNASKIEAGVDEVGRGCLAGPVVAAAVILPKDFFHPDLNDSKQLSQKKRLILKEIIEKEAITFAVAEASHQEIDQINILKASFMAMHRAIEKLKTIPEHLLIDGNRFIPFSGISHVCIVKGDALFAPIAAASVLAKTYRDDLMSKLSKQFPMYGWDKNVGYPTQYHIKAIEKFGLSPYHRKSFRVLPTQKEIEF
ncbi:MAG: ribonuclease HII [Flammeovirgaceae bacterium]